MALWTSSPAARALLAEAAANPPATRVHVDRFGDTHETATGRVARDLRKLWKDALEVALKLGDETRDYSAFDELADVTPEVAIERAVAAARLDVAA